MNLPQELINILAGTAATQDHMIYGKRKNSPLTAAYFDRFSHALELESW